MERQNCLMILQRFGCRLYSKKKRERERSQRARLKAFTKASRSRSVCASQGQTNVSQGQGQTTPNFLRRLEKKSACARPTPFFGGVQGPRSAGARVHTKPPPPPKKKNVARSGESFQTQPPPKHGKVSQVTLGQARKNLFFFPKKTHQH